MGPLIPGYLTPVILAGSVLNPAVVLFGLHRALRKSPLRPEERTRTFWTSALLLTGWLVVALVTALLGVYHPTSKTTPTVQYALLIPIVLGVVLFRRWPGLRRLLEIVPNEWMVGVQLYRALGFIFLVLYAGGYLPGIFALPAGLGDMLVGVLAPFVALAYRRGAEGAASRIRWWNWLGLTDLTVAVAAGFLSSPSRFQLVAFDRPSELITLFPLVMIPVFIVPLSILLHFASLYKLRGEAREQQLTHALPATEQS